MKPFNYQHLYYFYTVAKIGQINLACKSLKISQPTLSQHIQSFEAQLKKTLFSRTHRKLKLTKDGKLLFAMAEKVFSNHDSLEHFISPKQYTNENRIRLGVTPDIERPFVMDFLSPIILEWRKNQQVIVELVSGSELEIYELLEQKEIDFMVSCSTSSRNNCSKISSFEMPVIGVTRPNQTTTNLGHKLQKLDFRSLQKYLPPLALPTRKRQLRNEIDLFLSNPALSKNISLESDVISVIVQAVKDGVGCSFLPQNYVYEEIQQGSLVPFGPSSGYWRHTISFTCHDELVGSNRVLTIQDYVQGKNRTAA